MMIDLTANNVGEYIRVIQPRVRNWAGKTVTVIDGEEVKEETYVNYIFRVDLKIAGKRLRVYLRQTRDHVKTKPERKLETDRIQFEARILKILNGIKEGVVPEVLFLDNVNNVAVLSDIKRGCPLLVKELIDGRAHPETGHFFGSTIAVFHSETLGIEHRLVRGSEEENVKAVNFHLGMRLEPALKMYPQPTEKLLSDGKQAKSCLVLGDLASKNIFVDKDQVRFLDLERAFVGDPAFDPAFLFCHYLIEIQPEGIGESLRFINNFMAGYRAVMKENLGSVEVDSLENRVIRFLGVTILYRLFGFYLVINVERNKSLWTEIAGSLLNDTESVSVDRVLSKLLSEQCLMHSNQKG